MESRQMLQLGTKNLTGMPVADTLPIQALGNRHRTEVLDFLGARPEHTFVMSGWIHDNGLASPLNRGNFYGYRNKIGRLEGVALVGHVTLFETNSESALSAFARLVQGSPNANVVMGEEKGVSRFLNYYADRQPGPRLISREMVFEQRCKQQLGESVPGLRLATGNEIELVTKVHAEMAVEQTGVNPLEVDPEGFRRRCARRVEQGRVWISVDGDRLEFKADVIVDLPDVTYLEGIYVTPERRGNGFGARCMRQLTNTLLDRSKSVCLIIKEQNSAARACYQKAGYNVRDYYQVLFLQKK